VSEKACIPQQLGNCPWRFFGPDLFLPPSLETATFRLFLPSNVLQWQSARSGFPEEKNLAKRPHPQPIRNQASENVPLGGTKKAFSKQ
jgi:hypothetical protein